MVNVNGKILVPHPPESFSYPLVYYIFDHRPSWAKIGYLVDLWYSTIQIESAVEH